MRRVTVIGEEVPTNLVPAVAVKREGRAFIMIIGRKGYAGGLQQFIWKTQGLTPAKDLYG